MNFGSDKCTEISLVWNQLIIPNCFEACGIEDFVFVQGTNSVFCQEWKNLWHCSISKTFQVMLHYFQKENFNMWVTSGLFCGSSGSTGAIATHFHCDLYSSHAGYCDCPVHWWLYPHLHNKDVATLMSTTSTDHMIHGNLEILKILWNLITGYLSLAVATLFVSVSLDIIHYCGYKEAITITFVHQEARAPKMNKKLNIAITFEWMVWSEIHNFIC